MLNKLFYIPALALFLFSCNKEKTATLAPEYLYDAKDQKVISSVVNNKRGTISIVFGNNFALQSARDTVRTHRPGESYTMVTWRQKAMPHWYGTNMNADIYSVETVKILQINSGKYSFDYQFLDGPGYNPDNNKPDQNKQVNFIISRAFASFP